MKGEKSRALELAEKVIRKDPLDVTKVSLVSGGDISNTKCEKEQHNSLTCAEVTA